MKIKKMILVIFFSVMNLAVAQNYVLTIDGKPYDISLDKPMDIKVGGGQVSVKLAQKDVFKYTKKNFSFDHPKQYMPSKTDLGEGLFQTAMITPLGSVVMIQEYTTMAPSGLMDLMINELTKEERNYGYEIDSKPLSKTLSDGMVLGGFVVTSKYNATEINRIFLAVDVKDSGLFIMTQIDNDIGANDHGFIEQFYSSLKVTMK